MNEYDINKKNIVVPFLLSLNISLIKNINCGVNYRTVRAPKI